MRKMEIKDAQIMRIALQQEIMRSEESRYDHPLHGLLLVCSGLSCSEVASLFSQGRRTVQYWVKRFEKSGFAGLQEGARPGRPSALDVEMRQRIARDFRLSPRRFGYAQNIWDGKLFSYHFKQSYDVDLGVRQCQRLFRQFRFRRRKPPPQNASADPVAQKAFKKTPPSGRKTRR